MSTSVNNTSYTGLREKIAHANSQQEIVDLLKIGEGWTEVSLPTKLSWKRTAQRRIQFLQKPVESTASVATKPNKPTKKK